MNKFGLQRAFRTAEGCEVLEVKSIATKHNILTPTINIIMWVPEKKKELTNAIDAV